MNLRLSAIVISYNSSRTIRETLEGIHRQVLPEGTILDTYLFDDASTDSTVSLAKEVAADLGMELKVFLRPQNLGLVANVLQAIESIEHTDFVYITAADDFLARGDFLGDALNTLVNLPPASFACAEWTIFEEETDKKSLGLAGLALPELVSPDTWKQLGHPVFLIQSCLFRRGSLPYRIDQWMYGVYPEDWFLLCHAFQFGDAAVFQNNSLQYRCHAGGVSKKPLTYAIAHKKYLVNRYIRKFFSERIRRVISNPVWQMPRIAVLALYEKHYWKATVFAFKALISFSVSYSDKVTMAKNMAKVLFMGYVPRY